MTRCVVYTYELTLPFSSYIKVECAEQQTVNHIFDAACPVSATETKVFQIFCDGSDNPDTELWIKDTQQINDEDIPLVESQFPADVPFDLKEEISVPADRMSVEYRKLLVKIGLGTPVSPRPSDC